MIPAFNTLVARAVDIEDWHHQSYKPWQDQVANATGEIAWLGKLGNLPAILS